VLLAVAASVAYAGTNHLRLRAPREVVVGRTFYVTIFGKAAQLDTVWVYFTYSRCVATAHEEAVRGYPSFHRDVGPGKFKSRSKRIARRADTGYYCAYLYPRGANARSKPLARATRKIRVLVPDIPSQGRRPVGYNADGRQQLFMISSHGVLFTKYQLHPNSDRWSAWIPLPGHWPPEDAIGVGRNKDGRQQIYVVGPHNWVWTTYQTKRNRQVWSGWVSLGSPPGHYFPIYDEIGVGTEADGRQQLYLVGEDHQLYTQHQRARNDGWTSGWTSLGGSWPYDGGVGVGRNADGRAALYLVAYGEHEPMYMNYQTHANSDSWFARPPESWISLLGDWPVSASIGVGSEPDGRQALFVVGEDSKLYTQSQLSVNGSWSGGWTSLGFPLTSYVATDDAVGIGRNKDGRQQVYVIGYDGYLYTMYQLPSGDWARRWSLLGVPHDTTFQSADPVSVGRNKDGREQLYLLGADGVLYTKREVLPNSASWESGWESLGRRWPIPAQRGQNPG